MTGLSHHELQRAAIDAAGEAREHKRLARHHREMARAARERQASIERECRRLGIAVTTTINGKGEGDHPWPNRNCSSI